MIFIAFCAPRYEDALPCFKIQRPSHCPAPDVKFETKETEDEEEDDWFDNDDFRRRRKRSVEEAETNLRDADFEAWQKPKKGGYENCTCMWGLFRDRNVTLRKPVIIIFIEMSFYAFSRISCSDTTAYLNHAESSARWVGLSHAGQNNA